MKGSNILIVDPHDSPITASVSSMVRRLRETHVWHSHSLTVNSPHDHNPDMILAIFRYSEFAANQELLGPVCERYRYIPTIGIVDGLVKQHCCPKLLELLWGVITTPLHEGLLKFYLEKFLCPSQASPEVDPALNIKAKIGFELLIGHSPLLTAVKQKILAIAPFDVSVLIRGATGTGKELSARLIHFLSPRANQPFIPVNCGAIPRELFENELFGHRKGAYTHAETSEAGLIAAADGGTLFLDEIESMPLSTQVKLLRFLQERKYKPLGSSEYLCADVRIIAAAKENLWGNIQKGQFRQDLFYRLNVIQICLPLLQERKEDIPELTAYFIERYAGKHSRTVKGIRNAAMMKLLHHRWPGNVRELENVIHEAVIINRQQWIEPRHLDLEKLNAEPSPILSDSLDEAKQKLVENFERHYLIELLEKCHGNVSQVAHYARRDRRNIHRLLKKYAIDANDFRN